MEKLTLIKKSAYATWAYPEERGPKVMCGLYQSLSKAETNKKGIGWYGGDGEVEKQDVWQDEATGLVYIVTKYGKGYFNDDEVGQRFAKLEEIKAKLKPDELKFLFENVTYDQILNQQIIDRK